MNISIIVCVHNNLHLTRACLDSLQQHACSPGVEVLIVDDASTDATPQAIPSEYPWVRYLRHEPNLGYGGACTWGAQHATGDLLLLLNNDTVVEKGFLQPLVDRLSSSPRIGLVQARLLYPDRSLQHAGVAFNETKAPFHIYRGFPENFPPAMQARRFQATTGACALIPRALFEQLGGFSPSYRNGYEDVDQCLRLGQLGYETWYEPQSCVLHFESQSPTRHAHEDKNQAVFLKTWGDTVAHDEGRYYTEDGFPPILWRPLTIYRRPLRHLPLRWEVSSSASPLVADLVRRVVDDFRTRLDVGVAVETVAASHAGAVGFLRTDCPVLTTPVFVTDGRSPAPESCEEVWQVSADAAVQCPLRPLDVSGLSPTDQILALSFHCRPNLCDGYLHRGRRMLRQHDARSGEFAQACLDTFPREPEPHLLAGDWYWQQKNVGASLQHYEAAAEWVEPDYVSLRVASMLRSTSPDAARARLRRVLSRKPFHLQARWLLLRTHWE